MAIFIDKRFTVNGQSSVLSLDNHFNLDKHIQEVVESYLNSQSSNNTVILQIPLLESNYSVFPGNNYRFAVVPDSLHGYYLTNIKLNIKSQDSSATQDTECQVLIGSSSLEVIIPVGQLVGYSIFTPFIVNNNEQISVEVITVDSVEPPYGLTLTIEFSETI
jgi:hypothetical protein